VYVNEKDGSVLVYVPAGRVVVGTSDEELAWIRNWFPNLKMKEIRAGQPSHEVYLDGFFIGKFEVTNAQYGRFLEWFRTHSEERERYAHADVPAGNTPQPAFWKKPGYDLPDAPVVGVDWYDAWCYAHWAGLDLPSEAQWEKAAHWDPAKRKRRPFPWGEAVEYGNAYCADRFAGKLFTSNKEFGRWYAMSKGEKNNDLKPVSVRASVIDKSPVGAAGLCGNVAEWCRDNFHHYFYGDDDASERNVYDRAFYPGRAVRGGHFRAPMSKFFARIGWYAEPGVNNDFVGFRCIKPLVAFPKDVSPGLGEVELRALSPLLQKRTVMGLLQRMSRSNNLNGVVFRGRWAVDAFPEESNFYIRLGTALMDTDKVNDALLLFETGAKLPAPDCVVADLHYWQGRAHLIAGNVEAALEAFTRSIEVNPHQFWGNYYRGKTRLEKTGNYDGAILDFEKALEYDDSLTNLAMAYHAMGIARLKKGDLEGAVREYTIAVYLHPDRYRYRIYRADVYLKQKKWEKARDDYQALLDKKNYSWGYLGMVRLFRAQGDLKKALNAAEQGLKANNTDDSAYRKLEAQRAQIRRALGG
jgi:formylglycine-generating enzyme required for sulfatase activity/tetratricopeptide (TPR) repeat protein